MPTSESPRCGLHPGVPLRGVLRVPGSKSILQRALVCACLAEGETRLSNAHFGEEAGEDVRAALALAEACVPVGRRATELSLRGSRPGPESGPHPRSALRLGESGTLARLALGALGLGAPASTRIVLEASASLQRRGSPALLRTLRDCGVVFVRDSWPIELIAHSPPARVRLERPSSSQEVSALLIALASWPGRHTLEVVGPIPSRPYLGITRGVLAAFGVQVGSTGEVNGDALESFELHGPLRAPSVRLEVEPDASLAAVVLAAGCLSGGEVCVPGLGHGSLQGDVRIVDYLTAFGCRASATAEGLRASGRPVISASLDLSGEPDLAPVLAAIAAAAALHAPPARAWSGLTGLGTLPGKESSRLEVLARGLREAGWQAEAGADSLRIGPPRVAFGGEVLLDPCGDHRMAFAFALLGLVRAGIQVRDSSCVDKSWPGCWRMLSAAVPGG